ncbi:hypothetical protein [Paracoccus sanguinis]|uniref:hypothetical protein n=1 Tax=Paracoccus sanguinis TaxID=1545044 RepID=UPI00051FD22C|nr:hypothetical protein [Paracoccus sanguinis]KGJ20750.1 hypothetical protein IX55_05000 [Paracoccus sanguinis]
MDDGAGRLKTRLESEGAEFLVCGLMMVEGIPTYKSYVRMPGYDLLAVSNDGHRTARIQVKSRWATGSTGFIINNFDSDFVVLALLNRGKKGGGGVVKDPEFYVMPTSSVKDASSPSSTWGKISARKIEQFSSRRNAWHLIRDHLNPAMAAAN